MICAKKCQKCALRFEKSKFILSKIHAKHDIHAFYRFLKVFEKHNFQYKIIKKCFKLKSAYFAFGNVKVRAKITLTLTGLYFAC